MVGPNLAMGQNLRYLFGDDSPPKIVYFKGFWDVHRGTGVLTHSHLTIPGRMYSEQDQVVGVWHEALHPSQADGSKSDTKSVSKPEDSSEARKKWPKILQTPGFSLQWLQTSNITSSIFS